MKFDLETWGDGTLRLAHWDILHGDDVIIEIAKGAAYLDNGDDSEEINLPAFLEKLAAERLGNA